MIKMVRVDYRLLHGQVAFSWAQDLDIDAIFLISDTVQKDPLRMQALRMAKPDDLKTVLKNTDQAIKILQSGVTKKYRVFIICETIFDAKKIAPFTGVKSINIGNIAFGKEKTEVTNGIYLNKKEAQAIKDLQGQGYEVYAQMVPNEKKIEADKLLKEMR